MIASSILLDYMFFERDDGLCHYNAEQKQFEILCCFCFCWGTLKKCKCPIPLKGGGGDGGGGGPPRAEDGSVSGMPWLAAQN